MRRSFIQSYFIAALVGMIAGSLVIQPIQAYAQAGEASVEKAQLLYELIQNKGILQQKLRNVGDDYERRELAGEITPEEIKLEMIAEFENAVEQRKASLLTRRSLSAEEKRTKAAKYDAKLALEKRTILSDPDFSAKEYYYAAADRLGARDVDFIPFQKDDEWYESVADVFLFLIGVGAIVLLFGLILLIIANDSDHHRGHHGDCHSVWVPGYQGHDGHWHPGRYRRECSH